MTKLFMLIAFVLGLEEEKLKTLSRKQKKRYGVSTDRESEDTQVVYSIHMTMSNVRSLQFSLLESAVGRVYEYIAVVTTLGQGKAQASTRCQRIKQQCTVAAQTATLITAQLQACG